MLPPSQGWVGNRGSKGRSVAPNSTAAIQGRFREWEPVSRGRHVRSGDRSVWQKHVQTRECSHQARGGGPRPRTPATPHPIVTRRRATVWSPGRCVSALPAGPPGGGGRETPGTGQVLVRRRPEAGADVSLRRRHRLSADRWTGPVGTGGRGMGRAVGCGRGGRSHAQCPQLLSSVVGHCVDAGF